MEAACLHEGVHLYLCCVAGCQETLEYGDTVDGIICNLMTAQAIIVLQQSSKVKSTFSVYFVVY